MNRPAVTIAIATYNRADLWRRGLMFAALLEQTDHDAEVLIVDDNSTDDTLAVLRECLPALAARLPVRLFRCTAPKKNPTQADALPQNILIKEAAGATYVHADDDGWIDHHTVAFAKKLDLPSYQAAYYGELRMVKADTLELDWIDQRTHVVGGDKVGCWRIPDSKHREHGAMWITATGLLRFMGGHSMEDCHFRGSDTRLGYRIKQLTQTYYCNEPGCRFWHLGRSWTQVNAHNRALVLSLHHNPVRDMVELPAIANGGKAFWNSGALDALYTEIPLR